MIDSSSALMGFRFDLSCPQFVDDPYPTYRLLRDHHPAHFIEDHGVWLVTRHADVSNALTNPAIWSFAHGNATPNSAIRAEAALGAFEPPQHDELRAAISRGVTPARVRALMPEAREHARYLISCFARRNEVDIVGEFSRPLLNRALARLIGLDEESARRGSKLVEAALDVEAPTTTAASARGDRNRLLQFLLEQLAQRESSEYRDAEEDDSLALLVNARKRGMPLGNEEIASNMMTVLLSGSAFVGHFFGNLMRALWLHPDQKRAVCADKTLINAALEETVRWDTSTQCLAREATTDVEVAGVRIPAGSRALLFLASANRDERAFEDPDRFDLRRKRAQHLGFGVSLHRCFGAFTARQLCRAMLEELLPKIGDFDLDMTRAVRTRVAMSRGFQRLPLRF